MRLHCFYNVAGDGGLHTPHCRAAKGAVITVTVLLAPGRLCAPTATKLGFTVVELSLASVC